eukprot:404635_1
MAVHSFTLTIPSHIKTKYKIQPSDIPIQSVPVDTCFLTGVKSAHLKDYPTGDIWLSYYGNGKEESNLANNIENGIDFSTSRAVSGAGCGFAFYSVKKQLNLLYIVYVDNLREMDYDMLHKGKRLAQFLIEYVDKDPPYVNDKFNNKKYSFDELKDAIVRVIYPDHSYDDDTYTSDAALNKLKKSFANKFGNPDYPLTYFFCQYIAPMLDLHGWARKNAKASWSPSDEVFICPNQINKLLLLDCPQSKCARGINKQFVDPETSNLFSYVDFCHQKDNNKECAPPKTSAKQYYNNMMNNDFEQNYYGLLADFEYDVAVEKAKIGKAKKLLTMEKKGVLKAKKEMNNARYDERLYHNNKKRRHSGN